MMNKFWNIFLSKNKIFYLITLIYVSVFLLTAFIFIFNTPKASLPTKEVAKTDYFNNLSIKAKAVYVYDSSLNKVLFQKNALEPLPLASITKLMSVHCSLKLLDKDYFIRTPDKVWSYNEQATSTGVTEQWRVRDLAVYTLITSSNTGATVLSDYAGGEDDTIACMNKEAQNMNIFQTNFHSVTGLDIDTNTPGAVGSAENVATMLQDIYLSDNDIVNKTAFSHFNIYSKNGTIHEASNTNIVADKIVGFLGSKTGLTDIAGGNITYVMNVGLNHEVFVAILGSTEEGRFTDALTISDAVAKSYSN